MIDKKEKLSLRQQCQLLGLHCSGVYYQAISFHREEDGRIIHFLNDPHLNYPTEGVLQLQDFLRKEGFVVTHKRVRRLMRLADIKAIYPKRSLIQLGKPGYLGI